MRLEEFALSVLVLLLNAAIVQGFLLPSNSSPCIASSIVREKCTKRWSSKLFGPDDDDDDDDDDNKEREEGRELAQQFYKQMRQREGDAASGSGDASNPPESVTSSSVSEETPMAPSKKKFTGTTTTIYTDNPVPSPPFGSNRNDSDSFRSSNPGRQTPREQMMEREFQLVGRAESGLKYQALLAVCVAIFYAYVGLTGGIQSGGEIDAANNFGGDDMINDIILPVARDAEASYWL